MIVEAQIAIHASKAAVWRAITDIDRAAEIIRGISKIEIIDRPPSGLVGLRWQETRTLFGKPATVEKSITEAVENEHYATRAEDDGFLFLTTQRVVESSDGVTLISSHETKPRGFVARLKSAPMVFFNGVIRKAILEDLSDIKAAVEREPSASTAR